MFERMNRVVDRVTVETRTLETVLAQLGEAYAFKRPFLKLDTQGYDARIVAANPSATANFLGIQSELAIARLYEESCSVEQMISRFRACGFWPCAFLPNNPEHFPYLMETDCLFVRSDTPIGERPQ